MLEDITEYVNHFNYWDQIKKFLEDNHEIYNLNTPINDERLFKFLKNSSANLGKDKTTFQKFIKALFIDHTHTTKRKNILKLCFALNLSSIELANQFLMNYMSEKELSSRNLEEFVILCALNCQLSWSDVISILDTHKQLIDQQPLAPTDKVNEIDHQTRKIYENYILHINSLQDLEEALNIKELQCSFSRTRNKHYLALLDDVIFDVGDTFGDLEELSDELDCYTIQSYYNNMFEMHSLDGDIGDNFLTQEEINQLIPLFPDVFMNYGLFADLVSRRRSLDVPSGTYLLHLLLTIDTQDTDLTTSKGFIDEYLNHYLNNAGFPSLNTSKGFDKLVIDTYNETLKESLSTDTNDDIRQKLLFKLREYLKMYCKQF